MKQRPKYNQNAAIRGALRRAFARSPIVQEIMTESRREVPRYKKDGSRHKKNLVQRQCQVCGEWSSSSKMAVDHVVPVISIDDGFNDWNEFITRLWCDRSNLQRICNTCHDKKTQDERIERLYKKYDHELNSLESMIKNLENIKNISTAKELNKQLSKYTSKKKTKGLEKIVQRAQALKNYLKNLS